jgi:hypothetical protein
MRSSASALAVSILLTTSSVLTASASSVWEWSYSGVGITASGTFITVDEPDSDNGGYLITAITGTRNGQKITALQPAGTPIPGNEPYAVDNLVFKGAGAQLTSHGFGLATSDGNYANPFYANFLPDPGYLEFYSIPASHASTELPVVFSATLISTPEPGTCALVFIAFTLCGFTTRRMKRIPPGQSREARGARRCRQR